MRYEKAMHSLHHSQFSADSEYQAEFSHYRDAIWVHSCADGSTVGRFGKNGVDIHNTITEQLAGAPECRHCTHGRVTAADWQMFREKALEYWRVDIPIDTFDPKFFKESNS
ncbi:hypothetical protein [Reinekea sp. G2M2-21]|uniref:hypothetical protein n=1 Tax=Reinekea sp. G2M2-21 TaxID=2788942 RepID=UPI001E4E2295|nr:hypothetical protein [Reinekea sp. G2M2-21]